MATNPILDAPRNVQELHRQAGIQQTTWRVQRVGWWVLLLICLSGVLGAFGDGPLSKADVHDEAARLRYEILLRRQSDTSVTFDIPSSSGRVSLTLPASYLEQIDISDIQPTPLVTYSTAEGQTFVFLSPHAETRVRLSIRAKHAGWLNFAPIVNERAISPRYPLVLP